MIEDDDLGKPSKPRYRVKRHLSGAKFVEDAKTGRPAIVRWRLMIGMNDEEAAKAADLLNQAAEAKVIENDA